MWTLMLGWEGLLENHSTVELKSVFVISFSCVIVVFVQENSVKST